MIYCNLAILMAERKLKISKVASDTGISRTTLTALYYNTGQGVQYDTASALCIYFDVGMGELFSSYPYDLFVVNCIMQSNDGTPYPPDYMLECYSAPTEGDVFVFDCKLIVAKDTEFPRLTGTLTKKPLKINFNRVQHGNSDAENQLLTDMFKHIPRDCLAIVKGRLFNVLRDTCGLSLFSSVEFEFPECFVSEEN